MLAESYLDLSAATMGPAPTLAVLFNPFCLFTTAQVLALKASLLLLLTLLVKTIAGVIALPLDAWTDLSWPAAAALPSVEQSVELVVEGLQIGYPLLDFAGFVADRALQVVAGAYPRAAGLQHGGDCWQGDIEAS